MSSGKMSRQVSAAAALLLLLLCLLAAAASQTRAATTAAGERAPRTAGFALAAVPGVGEVVEGGTRLVRNGVEEFIGNVTGVDARELAERVSAAILRQPERVAQALSAQLAAIFRNRQPQQAGR